MNCFIDPFPYSMSTKSLDVKIFQQLFVFCSTNRTKNTNSAYRQILTFEKLDYCNFTIVVVIIVVTFSIKFI